MTQLCLKSPIFEIEFLNCERNTSELSLNFNFSEENVMLVDALGEAMKPWANERKAELQDMVENSVFPAEMWQTFADVGLLGCLVPEQYGGTDVG